MTIKWEPADFPGSIEIGDFNGVLVLPIQDKAIYACFSYWVLECQGQMQCTLDRRQQEVGFLPDLSSNQLSDLVHSHSPLSAQLPLL